MGRACASNHFERFSTSFSIKAPFTLAKRWHGTGEKWHGAVFFLARHDSFTLTLSSNFNSKFVSQGNGTARAILRYKVFSDSIWRLLGPDFNKSLWLFFQQIKGKRQANTHGSIIRKSNTNFFDILFRKLAKKRRVKYISTLLAYQYRERGIWMRPRTDAWLLLQKSYI